MNFQQPQSGATNQSVREMAEQIRDQVQRDVAEQMKAVQVQSGQPAQEGGIVFPPIPPEPPAPPREAIVIQHPFESGGGMPPGVVDISIAFFLMIAVIVVGFPLARAFARRLDRAPTRPAIDPAVLSQLQRIEHGMEAMSIEVERISESQRYLAKRLDLGAIPAETRR